MLNITDTALVLVDVQGRLAQLMAEKTSLFENLQRMVRGAQILGLPIVWAEQNPAKLGPTIPELAQLLSSQQAIAKMSFSCVGCDAFNDALAQTQCKQVLVVGIEAHICVCQTASDLVAKGYQVEVVSDAVASRLPYNKDIGIDRMKSRGVAITSTEMALFELMRSAEHPNFRDIQQIVR